MQTQHLHWRKLGIRDMSHILGLSCTRRPIVLIGILGVLLLVLSACGPNSSSTGSGTPTPTGTTGYGSTHGCPSDTVVSTTPKPANVTIRDTDINSTVTAHIGDTIEVRLPFGQKWTGPSSIPSNLQQQQPAGYALPSDNVCIWRFVAQSAGTARLDFDSQALCLKKDEACPGVITKDTIIIDVK
jgi:hypothetical protein